MRARGRAGPPPRDKAQRGSGAGAASGGGGAGKGRRAAAPPPRAGPDPSGDKGTETPPRPRPHLPPQPAFSGPVPLSFCPLSASLCPPVSESLSLSPGPSTLVLCPLSLSPEVLPLSLSAPLSPCLPLPTSLSSLSPTSVPRSLFLFSGSLCPPSSSLVPLLCPSVSALPLCPCLLSSCFSVPHLSHPLVSLSPVFLSFLFLQPLCHLALIPPLSPLSVPLSLCRLPSRPLQPPSWDPHPHPPSPHLPITMCPWGGTESGRAS